MAGTGRFAWHDLMTTDVEAAKRFYSDLFGWTYELWQPETMDYPMITAGDRRWGGMMARPTGAEWPPHWLGYVSVADVDATTEKVKSAGGRVFHEPTAIPGAGRYSIVADPQGAVFALHTSEGGGEMGGDGEVPVGGFCWDEVMTSDVEGALAFYRAVIGWEDSPRPMGVGGGTYHVLQSGGVDRAGLMAMPPGVPAPPYWSTYVLVEDADATRARTLELGGKAYTEVMAAPGVGRFATLADPQGAVFGVLQPEG